MSVLVSAILDKIFLNVNEPNGSLGSDGVDGLITRVNMLQHYNDARRKLHRKVGAIKGEFRIQGIENQIIYDYPSDWKSNMYRVEYDGKPLIKATLPTLDEYDQEWRNEADRSPPSDDPQFYVLDEPNLKFIVYPPPQTTGEATDLSQEDGIVSEIDGQDLSTEDGIISDIEIDGETIDLSQEDGIISELISQVSNLKVFYWKHLVDITDETTNLEQEFEPHQQAIEYFMKSLIYNSDVKFDRDKFVTNIQLFRDEVGDIEDEKQHLRRPMAFSVRRKPGKSWGRRGNLWGRRGNVFT